MALVIHPDPNADSFITVPDATIVIDNLTLDGNEWSALSPQEQEQYLRIAYRVILAGLPTIPTQYPACIGEAQALMAIHDLRHNISGTVSAAAVGAIKKQQVGQLVQEYYEPTVGGSSLVTKINRIPYFAEGCLKQIGYTIKTKTAGLKQTLLGRS